MPTKEAAKRIFAGMKHELENCYDVKSFLGTGAYGVVSAAEDRETGEKVAIKKILNAFHNSTDAKRTLREIKLMTTIDHPCILTLKKIIKPPTYQAFDDIHLVTEFMDTDLHRIIASRQVLQDSHYQFFIWQICTALKYLHSAQIIHRDIKPSNILIKANCEIKICDFGLARVQGPEQYSADRLTPYVATRWYRAPEVMLGFDYYSEKLDMWSVGLILAELLGRAPLLTGENFLDQIKKIVMLLGNPSAEDRSYIKSRKALHFLDSLPSSNKVNWERLFPDANPLALDLLDKLVVFNPHSRLSAAEALEHPYLAQFHDEQKEPVSKFVCDADEFEELEILEPEDIKMHVFNTMREFYDDNDDEFEIMVREHEEFIAAQEEMNGNEMIPIGD
ncbi:hypothetical protein PCE1_000949 [Barthelona sp. PCE]